MMKPFVYELQDFDPVAAFAAVQHHPYSLFLDSADQGHNAALYSFIACFPVETIESKDGITTITNIKEQNSYEGDPFAIVQDRIKLWNITGGGTAYGLPPFQGGAAGFFGYDLGRCIENLPQLSADNPDMIDMAIGIYDQIIAVDHNQNKAWIITHTADAKMAHAKQQYLLQALQQKPQTGETGAANLDWKANFTKDSYEQQVERVVDYIRNGDIFQANLSQRFDAELPGDFCPFSHYLNLREKNAAPFAAFMNLGNIKISSASPERFLFSREGSVETRPIKGTMARNPDKALDQFHRNALENSEKDRAENTMIVDLLRNDLSKVCEPDSVEVTDLCKLESFARVHHLVSTVKGFLREGFDALDVLRASFPGGSVTGAPKIRSMEIIEALEPTRRGAYCGAMGYAGFNGTMDTNILIRTLVYENNSVSFQVGGGITLESRSAREYQETLDKAEAIFQSFTPAQKITDAQKTTNEEAAPLRAANA